MTRTCASEGKGQCTMCCKVLPVSTINKPQGVWCQHARKHEGCAIYQDRPQACRAWRCMWVDIDAHKPVEASIYRALRRPDQVGYVIDVAADLIYVDSKPIGCMVVWADPNQPGAWRRDKVLIELIKQLAANGSATLIRHADNRGVSVWAPPLVAEWTEVEAPYSRPEVSVEEKRAYFGQLEHIEPTP